MKKETKELWRNSLIGGAIGIAIGIAIIFIPFKMKEISNQKTVTTLEVGMKISDLKWLFRAGKISEEEVAEYNSVAQNLNLEEMNQLLDELLEGKEEEYLEEKAELHEKVQSILNK